MVTVVTVNEQTNEQNKQKHSSLHVQRRAAHVKETVQMDFLGTHFGPNA